MNTYLAKYVNINSIFAIDVTLLTLNLQGVFENLVGIIEHVTTVLQFLIALLCLIITLTDRIITLTKVWFKLRKKTNKVYANLCEKWATLLRQNTPTRDERKQARSSDGTKSNELPKHG